MPNKGIVFVPSDSVPSKAPYRCPYCGVLTTITPIAWTPEHWIGKCDNPECGKIFYAKVKHTGTIVSMSREGTVLQYEIIETYPKYVPERHESIPDRIYLEACKCHDAQAFKATVVMCRRMMQNVCLARGAKNKGANGNWITLRDQIKEAFPQKEYSLIHSIADRIKYFGDYGAHPHDDAIDNVTETDSKAILDFTGKILDIAFKTPWQLKQMKPS